MRPNATARIAGVVGEGEETADVDAGCIGQHADGQDDRDDEDQIAAEVRQDRRGPDAHMVEQRLGAQDDRDGQCLHPIGAGLDLVEEGLGRVRDEVRGVPAQEVLADEGHEQDLPEPDIDRGDDEDQPQHVEPGRGPPEAASTQDRGPMIEARRPSDRPRRSGPSMRPRSAKRRKTAASRCRSRHRRRR